MKVVKVCSSEGSLGKNIGCEKAPDMIFRGGTKVDDVEKSSGDFYIGGDHSLSYNSFKGFVKNFKNPGLIIFDAHPDLYPEEFVNHENWVYWLIKNNILKKENLIFIGLNAVDEKEKELIDKWKIKCDLSADEIINYVKDFDGIYLSLDIDVLDLKFGTGYPEGKMNKEMFFNYIKKLKGLKNLKRVDLVEINPDKDKDNIVVELGKKIIGEFL